MLTPRVEPWVSGNGSPGITVTAVHRPSEDAEFFVVEFAMWGDPIPWELDPDEWHDLVSAATLTPV